MVQQVGPKGHAPDVSGAGKTRSADKPMPEQSKSSQSVGHLAKAQVAESGDTAPNAIGKAASLIAKTMLDAAPDPVPPTDPAPSDPPAAPGPAPDETQA